MLFIIACFLFVSFSYGQDKKEKDWNISVSGGMNRQFENDYLDEYDYNNNSNLKYLEFRGGYMIGKYHEMGIDIGQGEFTFTGSYFLPYIRKDFYSGIIDTVFFISNGKKITSKPWYTIYYNFHYKDYLYLNMKAGVVGSKSIESVLINYFGVGIGKRFDINENYFLKTEVNYSFIFDSDSDKTRVYSKKLVLSFGIGLKL